MTNQTNWTKYTGSDEQIAELDKSRNGLIVKNKLGYIWEEIYLFWSHTPIGSTHYWIIKPDPLREMKVRQAMTGQPVWVRIHKDIRMVTTTPDWNIPNAEYSFTEFKD